ncbi:MAG: mercury methylation corrinoid protein HgcA [candidate division Zixibacteria bacterium]
MSELSQNNKQCCCQSESPNTGFELIADNKQWIDKYISTPIGKIPRIKTVITLSDKIENWKRRWGIGRVTHIIPPGLYAVGAPTDKSPVFVSANYKMSFDCLRSDLDGLDGWILVLDTKGINVWCAAGKGTFGTDELVNRIKVSGLEQVVSHRKLIVPQLGATGVSAFRVKEMSGFRVVYGPVRSADIKRFLENRMRATPEMRRVTFNIGERVVLIPMEFASYLKKLLFVLAIMFILSGLGRDGYSIERLSANGTQNVLLFVTAYLIAVIGVPVFLPLLPGRSFSVKGIWAGLLSIATAGLVFNFYPQLTPGLIASVSWIFIIIAVSSFIGMNFTGASTYTSLSGVLKEMKYAVPCQISIAILGAVLWIVGLFI